MAVLQIHTLTALSLSLFFLIFIIKILFLIFMDFLPAAATVMTPLKRTYNVLNIEIKKFFFKLFLYDMWNYFCNQPQSHPRPCLLVFPLPPSNMAALASTNTAPYADPLNPPTLPTSLPCPHPPTHAHTYTQAHAPPTALVSLQLLSERLQ